MCSGAAAAAAAGSSDYTVSTSQGHRRRCTVHAAVVVSKQTPARPGAASHSQHTLSSAALTSCRSGGSRNVALVVQVDAG